MLVSKKFLNISMLTAIGVKVNLELYGFNSLSG